MTRWSGGRIECADLPSGQRLLVAPEYQHIRGRERHGYPSWRHGEGRDTLRAIQCCNHCGYCAPDIGRAEGPASEIVPSAAYKTIGDDHSLPELARHWLCWSRIAEQSGEPSEAGWAALSAAWACDDAGRRRAPTVAASGHPPCSRRSFARDRTSPRSPTAMPPSWPISCGVAAGSTRHRGPARLQPRPATPEWIAAGLAFQRFLCEREDRQRYSFNELERYRRAPDSWRPTRWWEIWRG